MSLGPAVVSRVDRRIATVSLIIATAMQAGDPTMINVALPQLERELGGGLSLGAWVMTSYLCAAAIMAPLTGWMRRRQATGSWCGPRFSRKYSTATREPAPAGGTEMASLSRPFRP